MDAFNIDLDSNDHKDLDVSLNNNSTSPAQIKVFKGGSSNSRNSTPSPTGRESNIGIDLLVNRKKQNEVPINNNVASIHNNQPPATLFAPSSNKTISIIPTAETQNKTSELDNLDLDLDTLLSDEDLGGDIMGGSSNNNISSNRFNNDNIFSINDEPNEESINFNTNTNTQPSQYTETYIETPLPPTKTYEEIQREKAELLRLLDNLESRGIQLDRKYNMNSDYNEMKMEYDRIKQKRETDQSIKFQRKMLIAFVTAIEFLNGRFDPFDIKLDGWSESVHENAGDYDDVFEELHEKYKSKAQMAPEIKLMLMLGGSGFMFHLTNTMFKSSIPGMGDIMKQNPDLMQQFAKAATQSMGQDSGGGSGFGNLMGDLMGGGGGGGGRPQRPPPNGGRREMSGPPNLDDILSDISASNNSKNVNIDINSNFSESEIDQGRNISVGKDNKKSLNLNL